MLADEALDAVSVQSRWRSSRQSAQENVRLITAVAPVFVAWLQTDISVTKETHADVRYEQEDQGSIQVLDES